MNDVALAWTVSAENALINHNGFSPAQLAFGKASYLPSTINDDLPALESTIWSVDHISVIQAATKAFITSEALEKIKLALKKKNIRNYQRLYELRDYVYYKRDSSSQWKCAAKVLGRDVPV